MPKKRQIKSKTSSKSAKKTLPKKSASVKQLISKPRSKKTISKKSTPKLKTKKTTKPIKGRIQSFAQRVSIPRRSSRKTKKRSKSRKLSLAPVSKMKRNFNSKNSSEMTVLIAKGSAAVAAAAGVVAAGAYLVDRSRRDKVGQKAQKAMDKFQRAAVKFPEEMPETYNAVQHEILNPTRTKRQTKSSKGKKTRGRKSR